MTTKQMIEIVKGIENLSETLGQNRTKLMYVTLTEYERNTLEEWSEEIESLIEEDYAKLVKAAQ